MMANRLSIDVCVALLVVAPLRYAMAQEDTARVIPPASMAGFVRDSANAPLADVEVMIPTIGRSVRTDSAGAFRLVGIDPRYHEVWFRRIGYITVHFDWSAEPGVRTELSVKLRLLPHTLDPVIVRAGEDRAMTSRSKVSGFVVDSLGEPVSGAEVQLVGSGRATLTGDDGSFAFRHVSPGTLALRARRLGYTPATDYITLRDPEDRSITLYLTRLAQTLDAVVVKDRSGYGADASAWQDFDRRMRMRSTMSVVLGPADLERWGKTPLDVVVGLSSAGLDALSTFRAATPRHLPSPPAPTAAPGGRGRARSPNGPGATTSSFVPFGSLAPTDDPSAPSVCVLENGKRPAYAPLRTYGAEQVETVEYYPPAPPESEWTSTLATRFLGVPRCEVNEAGGHSAYYVVWLKGSR